MTVYRLRISIILITTWLVVHRLMMRVSVLNFFVKIQDLCAFISWWCIKHRREASNRTGFRLSIDR